MNEREKEKINKKGEGDIKIDYDHMDVADIMDQIKRKIATEPKKAPQVPAVSFPLEPGVEELFPGAKGRVKRVLLKVMKPVSPLIKFLVLPVHEQIMETDRKLHQTNMRLDYLYPKLDQGLDNVEGKLDQVSKRLDQIVEYQKLLHNLSHNIVVELSKLKIEEENLKSKTRIMEKDFEFLGRREKALEREVFK